MSCKVFAYGTLRQGQPRFGVIPGFVRVLEEEAYLHGFRLVSLGDRFPALVASDGDMVRGELHLFDGLDTLDVVEGYSEDLPEQSLYVREKVMLTSEEGSEAIYAYLLSEKAHEDLGKRGVLKDIAGGDWVEYCREKGLDPR